MSSKQERIDKQPRFWGLIVAVRRWLRPV